MSPALVVRKLSGRRVAYAFVAASFLFVRVGQSLAQKNEKREYQSRQSLMIANAELKNYDPFGVEP